LQNQGLVEILYEETPDDLDDYQLALFLLSFLTQQKTSQSSVLTSTHKLGRFVIRNPEILILGLCTFI
jgi:hypothetical protein